MERAIHISKAKFHINKLYSRITHKTIELKLEKIKRKNQINRLYDVYYKDDYYIPYAMEYHRKIFSKKNYFELFTNEWGVRFLRLYNIAQTFNSMHKHSSEEARMKMTKRIRGDFFNENFFPFIFELDMLSHYLLSGFQVDAHNLMDKTGNDASIFKEGKKFQVEFKYINRDKGKILKLPDVYEIINAFNLDYIIKNTKSDRVKIIDVKIDTKIDKLDNIKNIIRKIPINLYEHNNRMKFHGLSIEIRNDNISPNLSRSLHFNREYAKEFISHFGVSVDSEICAISADDNRLLVFSVSHVEEEDPFIKIQKSLLDDVPRQLGGQDAAVLHVALGGETSTRIQEIAKQSKSTGAQEVFYDIAAAVFHAAPNLICINFTAGLVEFEEINRKPELGGRIFRPKGSSFMFKNRRDPKWQEHLAVIGGQP